ncbi:hypothetical protein acsn021_30880 [Anaerocolumna cellulosilytica]|uniref:Uncharacterized protein n=1 Tax=Anaerocolumna cellulosilytica TaxID=433286 RepID=A0A6S6R2F4_9FIRM|nr:SMI1/KNR4 family protein [Anaerocolumna cellulosilytica]MBB5198140.1 hypothetical protein [Anaerocolumna cellulosilytica]BCJ95519.1 hypothetical protein acsn021_30880 [Anaerocolumna cellulosilytica]
MNNEINNFIKWALDNKWQLITKNDDEILTLNVKILNRYKNLPKEYLSFLQKVKQGISPNEKSWFICEDEFNDTSGIAFSWNEFESISLEAAEDDEEWSSDITEWWDKHIPIVMSVENGYTFYAIDLSNGAVVKGTEPEFEETFAVASHFGEFLQKIREGTIRF